MESNQLKNLELLSVEFPKNIFVKKNQIYDFNDYSLRYKNLNFIPPTESPTMKKE